MYLFGAIAVCFLFMICRSPPVETDRIVSENVPMETKKHVYLMDVIFSGRE